VIVGFEPRGTEGKGERRKMDYRVRRKELVKQLFGSVNKIPNESRTFEDVELPSDHQWGEKIPGKYTLKVYKIEEVNKGRSHRNHRMFVVCGCGREIPVGRLDQHKRACG
jgi:hypothetical protein